MMHVKQLSERLRFIALNTPRNTTVADIGTDHAQLPVALALDGLINKAVASDVNGGPFQNALRNVSNHQLTERIEVRHGNGLTTLKESDEVDVITIAGMGGGLICDILTKGKQHLFNAKTLILQANVAAELVRSWLSNHGFTIQNETMIQEGEHFYEVIVAVKSDDIADPYDGGNKSLAMRFGPLLMKEQSDAFMQKWHNEYAHLQRIKEQIAIANYQDLNSNEAYVRIQKQIDQIEEVIPNVNYSARGH
ncbi:class I SAM-dependent methyltransferase [Geomicrobium sp. JCM 19038]|uniref:tRNA (adenine(22)-N(1))-methyltransferase n=1 Tax=Geomicrobium sp. JCM 19038 TaxID=1460635 RepID=UPI00187C89B7|nr:class I SAM-dependent methyltransferase [Geomicrobium sp. JCM 19038]